MRFIKSVSFKLLLILLLINFLIMGIWGIFIYQTEGSDAIEELNEKAEKISKRVNKSLEYPLWNLNDGEVNETIELEMADDDVSAIIVRNYNNEFYTGKISMTTGIKQYESNKTVMVNRLEEIYLGIKKPVMYDKQVIGYSEVYITDQNVNRYLRSMISTVVIQTVLLSSISIVILYILLRRVILKKIILLNNAVNQFTNKNFETRSPVKASDEIGSLSNSFNDMADTIQDYSRHLEAKVEERTEQLNKANHELQVANSKMMEELMMARRVQQGIIPQIDNLPHNKRLHFATDYTSMESIGGDLYDVIKIGKNRCALLIADVSGHGVPAALITTMVKVSFTNNSNSRNETGDICFKINKELYQLIGDLDYYLTAYYGIIDLETGIFKFTNAGHHPAILYRKSTNEIISLDSYGTFIGAFEDVQFNTERIQLEEGDRILLYTDGIVETRNNKGEFYEDRLISFVRENSNIEPKDFVDKLINDVEAFGEGKPLHDDRTVLYVEFVSKMTAKTSPDKALKIETRSKSEPNTDYELLESNNNNRKFRALYNKSIKYIKENNYSKAIEIILYLKEMKPESVNLLNNLGICYYKTGNLKKAYKSLMDAHSIDSSNNTLKRNLDIINKKINSSSDQ
jgi:serine phosphatase RsbU (regulator of sigma subunit)